jgi:ParB family chromosome partitioning protein
MEAVIMTKKVEPESPVHSIKYEARQLYEIDIKELHPDPNQPRKYFDESELNDLSGSIKKHGVLQPILFRKAEDGKLTIVSGERRYQASLLAKEKTIPGIFIDSNATEIALIENMLRVDLTPIEEAEGLHRLKTDAKYNNKELSAVIGKAEAPSLF